MALPPFGEGKAKILKSGKPDSFGSDLAEKADQFRFEENGNVRSEFGELMKARKELDLMSPSASLKGVECSRQKLCYNTRLLFKGMIPV